MNYIQSNSNRTIPHHFDAACAYYGCEDLSLDVRLTTIDEVSSGKFDGIIRNNFFTGSVEFMNEVFKRIGKDGIRLPLNSNRESKIMKLSDVLDSGLVNKFIKPKNIKLFTGFCLDGHHYNFLKNIPPDTEVFVYDIIRDIESEWRLYIHRNVIVDSKNYLGDFKMTPDYKYVEAVIRTNKLRGDFPDTYTIDIGVLSNGFSMVVEFNDMWAIGNYGLSNSLYVRMLRDRYFDIVRNG
jgi:hypothetical protein